MCECVCVCVCVLKWINQNTDKKFNKNISSLSKLSVFVDPLFHFFPHLVRFVINYCFPLSLSLYIYIYRYGLFLLGFFI